MATREQPLYLRPPPLSFCVGSFLVALLVSIYTGSHFQFQLQQQQPFGPASFNPGWKQSHLLCFQHPSAPLCAIFSQGH